MSFPAEIGGKVEGRDLSPLSPGVFREEYKCYSCVKYLLLFSHGEEDEGKLDDVGDDLGLHADKLRENILIPLHIKEEEGGA